MSSSVIETGRQGLRFGVVRGLALCQGALGIGSALFMGALVWSVPAGDVHVARVVPLTVVTMVVGALHAWLFGLACTRRIVLVAQRIRAVSVALMVVIGAGLIVGGLVPPGALVAAAISALFLLPMLIAIVVLIPQNSEGVSGDRSFQDDHP